MNKNQQKIRIFLFSFLSPFSILKPKENEIATESRESASQVLSDSLYSREQFH